MDSYFIEKDKAKLQWMIKNKVLKLGYKIQEFHWRIISNLEIKLMF